MTKKACLVFAAILVAVGLAMIVLGSCGHPLGDHSAKEASRIIRENGAIIAVVMGLIGIPRIATAKQGK